MWRAAAAAAAAEQEQEEEEAMNTALLFDLQFVSECTAQTVRHLLIYNNVPIATVESY